MQLKRSHNGKQKLFVRRLAFLMSICYLLNPLHVQISDVLHALTHGVQTTDQLISHSSVASKDQSKVHHYHDHTTPKDHDHGLIDFITTLFENSHDTELPFEGTAADTLVDNHTYTSTYIFKKLNCDWADVKSVPCQRSTLKGYSDLWLPPPIDQLTPNS